MLTGDMNDEVEAATTLILNGPPGSEIGSVGFDQPDQGHGDRMWNTASLIPKARRFSRLYRGRMDTDRPHLRLPGMPSIEDDPHARQGKPGSDHAAVVATRSTSTLAPVR